MAVLRCSICGRFYKQRSMSFLPPDVCEKCGVKNLPKITDSKTTKEESNFEFVDDEDNELELY